MSDPLSSYDILQRESGIERTTGEWFGRRVLSMTRANIDSTTAQGLISESLDNKWPDTTGIYAPCIHSCSILPFPGREGFYRVTLSYRRPTKQMILIPGRGLMRVSSYSTTLKKEVGLYRDSRDYFPNIPAGDWLMYRRSLERKETLEIEERALIILEVADAQADEIKVIKRATDWIGMGGEFTIRERKFDNLKLAQVEIGRRPSDLSVVDSTWQFAQKPDGWSMSGIIQEEWYSVTDGGVETAKQYNPNVTPAVTPDEDFWMAIKLRNMDSDVIRDYATFAPVEEYFSWMSS